jgi:hypothetical protein
MRNPQFAAMSSVEYRDLLLSTHQLALSELPSTLNPEKVAVEPTRWQRLEVLKDDKKNRRA